MVILLSSIREQACKNTENQFKEKRGHNTIIYYPNEIGDLLSQNNISADPDSRNSYTETDLKIRSIWGSGKGGSCGSLAHKRLLTKEVKVWKRTDAFCVVRITLQHDLLNDLSQLLQLK